MANTQLQLSPTNTNSRQKFTVSFWLKRGKINSEQCVWTTRLDSGNNTLFKFNANDTFTFKCNKSNADALVLTSNALFRDASGWYNFVIAVDTTQSTDTNRIKIYVNGVQETSLGTATYPSQNLSLEINEAGNQEWYIGSENNQNYFDGSMSYFAFVSETQEVPAIFGETDSTTGEWKIKTTITPSVAWGTNGFLILKDGSSLTDESSNSNNFASGGGTLTKTEDCPSNVFATMNPLDNYRQGSTFSNGNNTFLTSDVSTTYNTSSIMVNTGKFYAECKVVSGGAATNIGIAGEMADATTGIIEAKEFGYAYANNGEFGNNGSASSYGSSYANGDIIGIALDCTNNKLYFSKNGTFQDSGNPSAGSGGKTITAAASTPLGLYAFAACDTSNGDIRTFSFNFGNGFFGVTAVSSAGTNASGNGIFEYDTPTGYTALSTKGLNL